MSKETIEEFIEREGYHESSTQDIWEDGVREGAAWQAERMYSEEEVKTIAKDAYSMGRNKILIGVFNKWFEQFKKQKS
jgi:hypothetical protein